MFGDDSFLSQVREKVAAGGLSAVQMDTAGEDIEVVEFLGEGSFGKVGDVIIYFLRALEHDASRSYRCIRGYGVGH